MAGKRVNQFNLMLTDEELSLLREQAEINGFVNKSQYLRELLRDDAGRNKAESGRENMSPGARPFPEKGLLKAIVYLEVISIVLLTIILLRILM